MNREQAFEIYNKYLTSSWLAFDDKMKQPVKTRLLNNMKQIANQFGQQKGSAPSTLETALKSGKRVLFWSDTHFFHGNIIEYAGRPDTDFTSMNERLAKNYFDTVGKNDIVVWGGDCAFGNAQRAREYFMGMNFPGYKILIMGNHDFEKSNDAWRNMGIFDEVMLVDGFNMNIDGVEKELIFTHYPIDKSLMTKSMVNIHGHIHEKNIGYPWVNLSVEVVDYRPQTLEYCLDISRKVAHDKKATLTSFM